jgi:acetyl esterase/lipase
VPRAESREILTCPPPPEPTARILYGREPLQFGDLRLPSGESGPHPLVVFIHGGFWQAIYNLTHAGHLCVALAEAGIATWNLEYRRIGDPGGGWPGSQEDVNRGVEYVSTLAADWPLDAGRVLLAGHSAGGQLALCAACGSDVQLRGVISIAGVVDLHAAWERRLGGDIVARYLGGSNEEVGACYAAASPRSIVPIGVAQTLIHGTADPSVPFDLSAAYVEASRAAGDCVQLVPLEGAGHFEPVDPESKHWPAVQQAIEAMLALEAPIRNDRHTRKEET